MAEQVVLTAEPYLLSVNLLAPAFLAESKHHCTVFKAFVQRAFLLSALILQYLAILKKLSSSFNLIRIDLNPGTVDPTSQNGLLSYSIHILYLQITDSCL